MATSDGLEQIIIRGQGCSLISARELQEEIRLANESVCREYVQNQPGGRHYLFDAIEKETAEQIEAMKESGT